MHGVSGFFLVLSPRGTIFDVSILSIDKSLPPASDEA